MGRWRVFTFETWQMTNIEEWHLLFNRSCKLGKELFLVTRVYTMSDTSICSAISFGNNLTGNSRRCEHDSTNQCLSDTAVHFFLTRTPAPPKRYIYFQTRLRFCSQLQQGIKHKGRGPTTIDLHQSMSIHRGRAETVYRQPCPSRSRQHF